MICCVSYRNSRFQTFGSHTTVEFIRITILWLLKKLRKTSTSEKIKRRRYSFLLSLIFSRSHDPGEWPWDPHLTCISSLFCCCRKAIKLVGESICSKLYCSYIDCGAPVFPEVGSCYLRTPGKILKINECSMFEYL